MYVSNEKKDTCNVSAYRLFASQSNKQIVFVSFYETPCSLIYENKDDTKH